jgi:hypothetical protein
VKHFKLLWRASRDGFGVAEFHRGCDGHANTLALILDTDGNILSSFTPVEWEWEWEWKWEWKWEWESGMWTVEG